MSTRSVIAIPDGKTGFRGRFVHWDGYPRGVGQSLRSIILRDGMEKAIRTLIVEYHAWETVDAYNSQAVPEYMDAAGFVAVTGYGIAQVPQPGSENVWIERDTETWCEWAYVLRSDRIDVYASNRSKWVKRQNYTIRFPELSPEALHALDTEDLLALA